MATINLKYDYPYCGYGEDGRYQCLWSETRTSLNGCNTYPMVFNKTVPSVSHLKISIEIENTGSGTILGRSWDFMVRRSSGSWTDIQTFTLPDDGIYTIDCDIPNYSITQFAFVPTSNPGSSRTWSNWYDVEQLTVTETVTLQSLSTGEFVYGVFANRSGVNQRLNELFANIDGSLKPVKDVLVNVNGSLVSLPKVHSAYLKTTSESMNVYSFTVPETGTYKITQKEISGDHEIRLYGADFTPLYNGYFYNRSFDFTAGTLLYITVTHYVGVDTSESYLQIYKEA